MSETPSEAARAELIRRLVDRGLDEDVAASAVDQVRAGEPSPYRDLVAAEAVGIVAEAFRPFVEQMTQLWTAVQPALQQLAAQARALNEAMTTATACQRPPRRRDRRPWQSPYGPPPRRHGR